MNTRQLLRSASVIFSRIAATAGITPASSPIAIISPTPMRDVARRQHEDRQHAAGRIAPLHDQPGQASRPSAAAETRDEQRLGEHQREDRPVR